MTRLALRSRIALFFAALALGAVAFVGLGLWVGFHRAGATPSGFVAAGLIAGFGILALTAAIWRLFDEHVALAIERLATDLRCRAELEGLAAIDPAPARYLGDLGPAASALGARLSDAAVHSARRLALQTERLSAEREALTEALSQIPLAVLLVDEGRRITLYDGQAAAALDPVRPVGLGQSLGDYFDTCQLEAVLAGLAPQDSRAAPLATVDGTRVFEVSLRHLGAGAGYMLTMPSDPSAQAERPLALKAQPRRSGHPAAALEDLTFVIFDTETTGLRPDRDEVVQIGAVRALGRRLIPGEVFETLVDPGRPIPATATAVHGLTDAAVAGAPPMSVAGTRFLHFAQGATLVAHNAAFDMAFLRRHAEASGAPLDHPVLDTVLLGAALFGTADPLTLDALAERLAVDLPPGLRHTALGDARATADIFLKMLDLFEARGVSTLGELVASQRRHARLVPDLNPG